MRLDLGFPFTTEDTPAIRARLEHDLAHIVGAVTEADRRVRAVVLTGGFARGEGSVLEGAPLNDYDLVVVRSVPGGADRYAALAERLAGALGIDVDLAPIWQARLPRVARSVFWYETRCSGRVIAGDSALLARVPVTDASQVAPEEAARLLFNRAAGLLLAVPPAAGAPDPGLVRIKASKAFLACAEALLLLEGQYHWSYRERLERFHRLASARESHAPGLLAALGPWVEWATRFKLDPARATDPVPTDALWSQARTALLATFPVVFKRLGWPPPERFPDGVPDAIASSAFYVLNVLRGRRGNPFVSRPSLRVRALTLALLRESVFPGGVADPGVLAPHLRPFGRDFPAGGSWEDVKVRLEELRGLTLQ